MKRYTAALLAMLCAGAAVALEPTAAGTYAVVHRDGHVTDKVFRMTNSAGRWRLEDRKPDGAWSDVTCQTDCMLRESGPDDVRRLFGKADLESITPTCVHNSAFAFCSYTPKAGPASPAYLLVVLISARPAPIRLARLKGPA